MLGSQPLEAVLGTGIDNTDHEAVRAFIRAAADLGLNILFIYPDSKVPADMRTPVARNKDDRLAQEAARDAGRGDWRAVRSPAGLALATSEKTVLDRYLKRYIEVFSTWHDNDDNPVAYTKKAADADEIHMAVPVAVNLAVEVGGSGLVVVDCDTAAQMRRWFEANEMDPDDTELPAPTVITPGHMGADADPNDPATWSHSDGGHFYFTVPDELMPVLPRHIGALTWGGDDGFAVLWDRRYVLIPPSTRPEGAYEQLGHVYELPDWLAQAIIKAGENRLVRANRDDGQRTDNPDLATRVDEWAASVSWSSILEPMGWVPGPRADACGCAVWTAPGVHASPKSATAHDPGCSLGRYTETNAPLHLWTDHDAPPFTDGIGTDGWTPTFSKLQAVALIAYKGNVGEAMDDMGITPDLSVDPDIDPKAGTEDTHDTDGDFSMPTNVEVTITDGPDPDAPTPDPDIVVSSANYCGPCNTRVGLFVADDDGILWHAADEDDAAETGGHRADGLDPDADDQPAPAAPKSADDMLADMPADFGKAGLARATTPRRPPRRRTPTRWPTPTPTCSTAPTRGCRASPRSRTGATCPRPSSSSTASSSTAGCRASSARRAWASPPWHSIWRATSPPGSRGRVAGRSKPRCSICPVRGCRARCSGCGRGRRPTNSTCPTICCWATASSWSRPLTRRGVRSRHTSHARASGWSSSTRSHVCRRVWRRTAPPMSASRCAGSTS